MASFVGLPQYEYGKDGAVKIEYTVSEPEEYPGFERVEESVASGDTIHNTLIKTPINLVKVSSSDEKLDGVEFKLYSAFTKEHGCSEQILKDADGKSIESMITGAEGEETGSYKLSLAYGTYYLNEEKTKDGYILPAMPVKFTVSENGVQVVTSDGFYSEVKVKVPEREDVIEVEVTNETGVELPSTGGIGTGIFTLIGSVMIAFAGIWMTIRRRCVNA